MITLQVNLDRIEKVKRFTAAASHYPFPVDLCSGRYVVDGKSIMGIFSLDLENPLEVHVLADEKEAQDFLKDIKSFIISEADAASASGPSVLS